MNTSVLQSRSYQIRRKDPINRAYLCALLYQELHFLEYKLQRVFHSEPPTLHMVDSHAYAIHHMRLKEVLLLCLYSKLIGPCLTLEVLFTA